MNRFGHVLRRADAELRVPEPHRSRILLEVAQDLDDLYRAYLARGLSSTEAAARAEALLDLSDTAMDALARLHAPFYARLVEPLSHPGQRRLERVLLTLLTLAAVAVGGASLAAAGIGRSSSPFLWPLLALLGGAAWVAGRCAIDLFLRPYAPSTGDGIPALLSAAAASAVVGGLGAAFHLWRLARNAAASDGGVLLAILPHLRQAAEALTLSLTVSLAILLAWFHLRERAVALRRERRMVLHLTDLTRGGTR